MRVEVQQQEVLRHENIKMMKLHQETETDADLDSALMMTEDTSVSSSASAEADGVVQPPAAAIAAAAAAVDADKAVAVLKKKTCDRGSVRFSTIEIKEYPRCMGDNPAVTGGGPPITIGWEPISTTTLDLEDYEAAILPPMDENENDPTMNDDSATKRVRRTPTEFQLPAKIRYEIIYKEASEQYTKQQVQDCLNDVQRSKWNRQSSFAMAEFEHIQVVVESCCRKLRRFKSKISSGGSKKRKQKKTNKGKEKKV